MLLDCTFHLVNDARKYDVLQSGGITWVTPRCITAVMISQSECRRKHSPAPATYNLLFLSQLYYTVLVSQRAEGSVPEADVSF